MLREIVGIQRIQKLYLQLLYTCNFNCQHCFHGEKLQWKDSFTFEEVKILLSVFRDDYGISSVTLLGGEPFLYSCITEAIGYAKEIGLRVEICTNGYKVQRALRQSASQIDNLRVSLEGLERTNDQIRHRGSFKAAFETLNLASELGVYSSVTMTVTSKNIAEVIPLAREAALHGARALKLHALRPIGNVRLHKDLVIVDARAYETFHKQLAAERERLSIDILLDDDLDPQCDLLSGGSSLREELERIEVQPSGELYVSCKAVGADSNAFIYDKVSSKVLYRPRHSDELRQGMPQVRYFKV